jgi:hypothetical protein
MWETYHERKEKYEKEMEEWREGKRKNLPISPDGGRDLMEDDPDGHDYMTHDENGEPYSRD